jgi:hypothetical protein
MRFGITRGKVPVDVASANGERRFEPPHREGRRLPPLWEMSALRRREFHDALLDVDTFEDLTGKWQAAIPKAEQKRPNLRIVGSDQYALRRWS